MSDRTWITCWRLLLVGTLWLMAETREAEDQARWRRHLEAARRRDQLEARIE